MILHRLFEDVAEILRDWGYHNVEVEIRIGVEEVAEDARCRLGKETATFLFDDSAHLLGAIQKPLHDLGEEGEVAGVVGLKGAGHILLANKAQGATSL